MEDLKNLNYLLPDTQKVLLALKNEMHLSNFVLVGGSALSLYLCHRKSEDLDFFTFDKSGFDIKNIKKMVSGFRQKKMLNLSDDQVDFLLDGVKVTFFDAQWRFLKPIKIENLNVATLEQLVATKVNVLLLRAKFRDYYDLYFLSESFSLKKMFDLSKNIVEGLTFKLFITALLYIDDIEDESIDYLDPKVEITLKNIRDNFEKKIQSFSGAHRLTNF